MANISVIIPCFNVEQYLPDAVASCLDQTLQPSEVIIVDNHSTDKTVVVAQSLVDQYPNLITLLHCYKNGAPAARNMGLKNASCEWIQFLDADDLLLPDKLKVQSRFISENIPFIAGGAIYQQLDDSKTSIIPDRDIWKGTFKGEYAGNTCSNLWNRHDLDLIGGWNEDLKNTQDYDLIFRLIQQNENVAFSDELLTIHRDRPAGQISKKDPSGNWRRALELRLDMFDYLKAKKESYFLENKQYFEQILFAFISNYAKYNLTISNEFFVEYLGKDFKPVLHKDYYNKPLKMALFFLFGFRRSELIWNKLRQLFS